MPKFGFSREDAEAVLSALQADSQPVDLPPAEIPEKLTDDDISAGRELILSTGCLACHSWQQPGRAGDFGGPSLDQAGQHRTAKWLDLWLSTPEKLNADHRMPVFKLSNDERRQIVSALLSNAQPWANEAPAGVDPEAVRRGKELIHAARCAACHELPGKQPELLPSPTWATMKFEHAGCWNEQTDTSIRRPGFSRLESSPLREFLRELPRSPGKLSADQFGAQLLIQKGCLNCHDRDGRPGISAIAAIVARSIPELEGQAPWLVPPPLTAVGDRLPDARLAQAVHGEIPKPRLDWLKVRMPKFQHADHEQTAILAHLIGHDRIPDQPPASLDYSFPTGIDMTLAGRELIGGKGFSCVACHPVKDFTPKNVALGTRGSNLFLIGERLRPEYFFRWTRSPLRVMPGVEMPSYQRPHAVILSGDLNRQLAAIWTALNDPKLPTPVNPGAMEQYWTVQPGDLPRVLRDVVTLPGKKKETATRAFAAGFPNGQNVLFDLDRATVRAWTIGDFAQQRTQGKSWYWDLVGTPVL
ncbi:MAG: c-type cytochrome, partial [Planctomycetaceae bacterium]